MQLSNISKSFGDRHVLEDLNINIEKGKKYAVMGPSGCGKTTLLRIMLGLEKPDLGTVKGRYEKMAAVFQEDRLCEDFNAVKNVWITADNRHFTTDDAVRHLHEVGLEADRDLTKPVKDLSGGMRRRVAIVRAVLSGADCLILDEPFTGMDELTYKSVISYIREYTTDKTMVLVTHREEDADRLGAEIISLHGE
ncbi:MAG: ATP-binding cassette domain-containing protein [Lachnospira sp.]